MLHIVVRCLLAAVLVAAALLKAARPGESRSALQGVLPGLPASGAGASAALGGLITVELALAGGVAAGSDAAALVASVFMLVGAALLGRALQEGRDGAPCGCFGARSKVSRLSVGRSLALAGAFLALPFIPRDDLAADTWLAIGLGVALLAVVALGIAVLALAREVGMLRLAVGPQSALEVPEEGPPLGSDSGLGAYRDPRADASVLGLAVFTSDGCRLCRSLEPAIASLARDPHVTLVTLDEVRDAEHWARLDVPGSPYAVALDERARVLAKGTFNSLPQLESVLAAAERRRRPTAGV
jgi:hypothetical protein